MYKTLEKRVDNSCVIHSHTPLHTGTVDIHKVIKRFFRSFPRICNEKRYKLINFATLVECVDKTFYTLIYSN